MHGGTFRTSAYHAYSCKQRDVYSIGCRLLEALAIRQATSFYSDRFGKFKVKYHRSTNYTNSHGAFQLDSVRVHGLKHGRPAALLLWLLAAHTNESDAGLAFGVV